MPSTATLTPRFEGLDVGKKRHEPDQKPADKPPEPSAGGRPVNFRATKDLFDRLTWTAEGLGLDVSNLIRMVLKEHLHIYEERVEALKRRQPPS